MKKISLLSIIILFLASYLFAEVEFQLPVFNQDNNLIVTAKTDIPGIAKVTTLFSGNVEQTEKGLNKTIKQLSFFPEQAVMLNHNKNLQIRNRFGIFRTTEDFSTIVQIQKYPSFTNGATIANGKLYPLNTSPNGNFFTLIRPTSFGYGKLVLIEAENGKETTISDKIELNYSENPVLWSPDSKIFIYAKNNSVYYYSIEKFYEQKSFSDNFRKIGKGSIRSVYWTEDNILFYFKDRVIYKIISAELFTGSLYNNLVQTGEVAGRIPFTFNYTSDSFFVSPAKDKIIYNKAGTNIFLYPLMGAQKLSTSEIESLPYLYLPENTRLKKLLWPTNNLIILLTTSLTNGQESNSVFCFNQNSTNKATNVRKMPDKNVINVEINKASQSIAIMHPHSIEIKNYQDWLTKETLNFNNPLNVYFLNSDILIVAGLYSIEKINLNNKTSNIIALSQAEESGYTKEGNIYAITGGINYELNNQAKWNFVQQINKAPSTSASESFRGTLQALTNSTYKNMIYLKSLETVATEPLFSHPEIEYSKSSNKKETIDLQNFSHGSRTGQREVAVVFNAVDSAEGLTDILKTLEEYNIKATFFLNGDFISRNPDAVKELGNSGHEIGSLFFTYFNMTDARFRMDSDFIKKGLAKNEDDYFAVTGKELSPLWHAPYYSVNSDIIDVSSKMNYYYINRDVYTLEWLKRTSSGKKVASATEMVEKIMKTKKSGSIIPIMIGESGNDSPLYTKLDLLINNLIKEGYSLVPVSALIEKVNNS